MIRGMVRCKSERQLAKSYSAWFGRSSDYLIQHIALVGVVVSGLHAVVTHEKANTRYERVSLLPCCRSSHLANLSFRTLDAFHYSV